MNSLDCIFKRLEASSPELGFTRADWPSAVSGMLLSFTAQSFCGFSDKQNTYFKNWLSEQLSIGAENLTPATAFFEKEGTAIAETDVLIVYLRQNLGLVKRADLVRQLFEICLIGGSMHEKCKQFIDDTGLALGLNARQIIWLQEIAQIGLEKDAGP